MKSLASTISVALLSELINGRGGGGPKPFDYWGVNFYRETVKWDKTCNLVAVDGDYQMYFEWYIIARAADDPWLNYPHCPFYLLGELTLLSETKDFVPGQKITQFFDFYEPDKSRNGPGVSGEQARQFSETVEVSVTYPGKDEVFDFEKVVTDQECWIEDTFKQTGTDCPWYPASADCWEVEDDGKRVKFVMERWMPEHYEPRPFTGLTMNLRAGFSVQTADE